MRYAILDCYTDEPSGLGVPPYLGVYPRYIYGYLKSQKEEASYITIDDLRLAVVYNNKVKDVTAKDSTNIRICNSTGRNALDTIRESDMLIIILGVHVPGKYLSAMPGTLSEVRELLRDVRIRKILTGPAVFGTQLEGGKFYEKSELPDAEIRDFRFSFDEIRKYAVLGADITREIRGLRIAEIETGRGCNIGTCSFCMEPLKNRFENRRTEDIIEEIRALYSRGIRHFRLGKQSDFYAIENPVLLLRRIHEECPGIECLHIDNVNPVSVVGKNGEEITEAIVRYCTPGNVAALGIESFDPLVARENSLNCSPEIAIRAIERINRLGSERGENGMPKFLPGVNLIFGLMGETRKTHEFNMAALQAILDKGLMLRRINIRQVAILQGTRIYSEAGNKFLKKNKRFYWKWRNDIREKIDFHMLGKIVPEGTVLAGCYSEIYDGMTTFARQVATYPLIVGVKGRVGLKKFYDIRVKGYMVRSVVGEVVRERA